MFECGSNLTRKHIHIAKEGKREINDLVIHNPNNPKTPKNRVLGASRACFLPTTLAYLECSSLTGMGVVELFHQAVRVGASVNPADERETAQTGKGKCVLGSNIKLFV